MVTHNLVGSVRIIESYRQRKESNKSKLWFVLEYVVDMPDRKTDKMTFFYETEDGYRAVGEISELELSAETVEDDEIRSRFLDSKSMEMTAKIEDVDRLERLLLGQSRYNAMVLKRDGYLSPENGWVK